MPFLLATPAVTLKIRLANDLPPNRDQMPVEMSHLGMMQTVEVYEG